MIILGKKIRMKSLYLRGKIIPVTEIYLYNYKINSIIKKEKQYYIEIFFYIKKKIKKIIIKEKNILREQKIIDCNYVNIISYPKMKGFMGVIKKNNFSSNRKTHGNSKAHNKPGSIGMCQDPGRVFKGKKMPGRKKKCKKKVKNIKIINLDKNKRIIDLFGSIPGKKMSNLFIEYDI
ncbi:50S ribosomal protein L3 [Candidatus Vidania fulgoroideae]|uniref:Large ribosomal subunit protein uL3 n=1 Tax=Candidatus Vidania fulgoroideorum TaxID=881286 RepID=A0AAX3N8H7_9PROT|nr:50S ribosomal protein L3 [Candidatus Vidania fulgoroideae]